MSRVKQASTKKRVTKAALPALGAAGLTFSLTGGASASAVPIADVQQTTNLAPIWRSCSAKKKSQMSAWRRSMSSTMRTLAAAYRSRGVAVAAAAAAAVAVAPAAEPAEAVAAPAAAALPADLAALPGASAACAEWAAWLPATLTSEYRDGRVRQGRPGRSMSASRGRMPTRR